MKRKLIVNRSFQFRSGARMMFLTLLLTAPIVLLLGVNASRNSKTITTSINSLGRALAEEQRIVDDFVKHAHRIPKRWVNDDGTLGFAKLNVGEVVKTHDGNVAVINEFSRQISEGTDKNTRLIYIIAVLIMLQAILIFYFMLRFTHHIAGPAHHMEGMIRDMIDGKEADTRPLRKGDKLVKLHGALVDLNAKIMEEKKKANETVKRKKAVK